MAERELVLLGTAQDGGAPQMGASDAGVPRTAASACLVDGGHYLLIDASPDLRHQWLALQRGFPGATCSGVVLTHAHMGHYTGLVQFGREAANTKGSAAG